MTEMQHFVIKKRTKPHQFVTTVLKGRGLKFCFVKDGFLNLVDGQFLVRIEMGSDVKDGNYMKGASEEGILFVKSETDFQPPSLDNILGLTFKDAEVGIYEKSTVSLSTLAYRLYDKFSIALNFERVLKMEKFHIEGVLLSGRKIAPVLFELEEDIQYYVMPLDLERG